MFSSCSFRSLVFFFCCLHLCVHFMFLLFFVLLFASSAQSYFYARTDPNRFSQNTYRHIECKEWREITFRYTAAEPELRRRLSRLSLSFFCVSLAVGLLSTSSSHHKLSKYFNFMDVCCTGLNRWAHCFIPYVRLLWKQKKNDSCFHFVRLALTTIHEKKNQTKR